MQKANEAQLMISFLERVENIVGKGEDAVNSLPNDNFSDWSKSKALGDDKITVTEILECVLG